MALLTSLPCSVKQSVKQENQVQKRWHESREEASKVEMTHCDLSCTDAACTSVGVCSDMQVTGQNWCIWLT